MLVIVPESDSCSRTSTTPGSRFSNFCLGGAELKPRIFTDAPVIAAFGFFDFIIYGDVPKGGITSIIVVPIVVSKGCLLKSS